jgi:antitoxin (DNA-binding transcriptional repressor) of toxin-antitoxin stability system
MITEISAAELEAQFFEVMKRVCQGESFAITTEGNRVAEIRPNKAHSGDKDTLEVLQELCSARFAGASDETVRAWLHEDQK